MTFFATIYNFGFQIREKHKGDSSFTHTRVKLTLRTSGQRGRGAGFPVDTCCPEGKKPGLSKAALGRLPSKGEVQTSGSLFATGVLTSDCPWGQEIHVSPPKKYH